jgi:hypothetical protein
MTTSGADALWVRVAARLRTARGWSLRPLARLGRGRADRVTWLAEGEPGTVIVKAVTNPFAPDRAGWVAQGLSVLAQRGYPVPVALWHGRLDARWWLTVQQRLPGEPLSTLDAGTLGELLGLVELQAEPGLGPGGIGPAPRPLPCEIPRRPLGLSDERVPARMDRGEPAGRGRRRPHRGVTIVRASCRFDTVLRRQRLLPIWCPATSSGRVADCSPPVPACQCLRPFIEQQERGHLSAVPIHHCQGWPGIGRTPT